ncbi:MAG: glucosaminidase domain-containing protein, partial [Puniceicoccales bacterium]|nr:glucosaminidase domain-containing protein [Puniceicoccales bacterium]
MGKGGVSEGAMVKYLREYNRKISQRKAVHIVRTYVEESSREGINHDVAFIQMCHETDFLRFSGTVSPSQNNFCGLGTVSESVAGYFFPNIRTGIRAHIQHLKAYASSESLANRCVDPRFTLVRRNSASDIFELTGKWAADKRYGELLKKKMDCLIDMENAHRR